MHYFQQEAIKQANHSLSQSGKALLIMATGSGKSLVASEIARSYMHTGQVLIVVELKTLALQFKKIFDNLDINSEVVDVKRPVQLLHGARILIATISNLEYISTQRLNLHLVIVFDGYSSRKTLLKKLTAPYFGPVKKCLISNVDYFEARQIAGHITFMYGMPDAFEDGILHKIETISISGMDSQLLTELEGLRKISSWIVENVYRNKNSKIVIICKDHQTAIRLKDEINAKNGVNKAITVSSYDANPYWNIDAFRHSETINIALTINLFYFFSSISVTDVVLLKKMPSQDAFSKVLSSCARQDAVEPRVWDFADNKKYYFEEMGTFIQKSLELTIVDKNSRRKLINPLDDQPATVDMLGRIEVVELLDNILAKDSRENLSLALLGKWGMGKSSILAMLKKYSRSRSNLKFISYNAWHEEHSESVLSSMANKIIDDLYESKNLIQQLKLNFKSRLISARTNLKIELIILLLLFVISVYQPISASGLAMPSALLTMTFLGAFFSIFISIIKTYLDSPITKKIRETFKKKNFSDHIGLGQAIKSHLSSLFVSDATPFNKGLFSSKFGKRSELKYIIAIDDLDRCSDAKIIDTISALQLLSTIPNVNIIIAIDYDVLINAFKQKWQNQNKLLTDDDAIIKSRDYLGKIFQASIAIETPARDKINNFIHKGLYKNVKNPLVADIENAFENNHNITDIAFDDFNSESIDDLKTLDSNDESDFQSQDFLDENYHEYELFIECAKVFNINNPRTLVRMHNTVTFIKGLNSEDISRKSDVAMHIFFVFWYETWCSQNDNDKGAMELAISTRIHTQQDKILLLAKKLEINSFSNAELNLMLNNVIRVSLPFTKNPTPFCNDLSNTL